MSSDHESTPPAQTNTSGGAAVGGDVNTGGDFVGRDQIRGAGDIHIHNYATQPPPTTTPESDPTPAPGPSPYQGMKYFDVADADRFFGREQLTVELVEHLRHSPLLAVVGASGSGKSSLVRAGLIPALQGTKPLSDGSQPPPQGSARWAYHIITPTARPLESLAASLTRHSESVTATSTLIDDLRSDARSLHLAARRLVNSDQRLLLVVDQLEELFTLCKDRSERQAFVENLLHAAQTDGVVTLVVTLRADFYHHCAEFPALRAALETQQKYIGTMSRDDLRRAIEQPAHLGQWELQAGLVDQLLADVGDEPGALPLLSHALLETWKRRSGRTLTLAGYRSSGGVQGAIAKTADDIYRAFSAQQQTIARTLFLRLTELGEGAQDTRRRVRPDELKLTHARADEVQQVLQTLADARLVTTAADEVQVAHEALIRAWATLRAWLDDDREGQRIHRRLTEAANEWVAFGKEPTLLYRGLLLQQAHEWLQTTIDPPNQRESEFLTASLGEAEAEAQRAADLATERETNRQHEAEAQTRGKWLWRLGIALILAILAIFVALWQYSIANDQRQQTQVAATREAQAHATVVAAKLLVEADLWEKEAVSIRSAQPLLALLLTLEAWPIQQSRGEPHVTNATRNMINLLLEVGGLPFIGHTARIHSLEFSPDSYWLVSASDDTTVRLWGISDSTGKSRVFSHPAAVQDVSFSPDNRWLATASDDQTIRLWAMDALDELPRILRSHTNAITQIAFSQNSQQLIAVDNDQTIELWNLGQVENEPTVSSEYTEFCHTIASVSSTSEWGTFCEIRTLQNNLSSESGFLAIDAYYLNNIWLDTNKQWLAGITNNNGKISLWSTSALNGDPQVTLDIKERSSALAFSPGNRWLVAGTENGAIYVSYTDYTATGSRNELEHFVVSHSFHSHETSITAISFSPDGKWLASASADGALRLWSVKDYVDDAHQESYFPELNWSYFRVPSGCKDACLPGDPFCVECQKYNKDWDLIGEIHPERLETLACLRVGRNFTLAEWQKYLGDIHNYHPTCPQWPIPEDVVAALPNKAR